ncbi:hypothetical protein KY285_000982 [Solanum tuberosum]|nr:hypothetical protein KY285_000982 [Solanum tuberosum]
MSSPVSLLQHESQLTAVTSQYSLVDTPNLATTRSGRSIISLEDIVQIGGPKAIQQSGNKMQQPNTSSPPAQTLTPIKFTIETSNADGKPGITQPVRNWKNAPMTSGSTQFESDSSPNHSLPTAAANSAFTLSVRVIHSEVVNKSQGNEISFSSQASIESSLSQAKTMPSASASSSQRPMLSTISSTWSISKANMGSNQKDSQSQSSVASLTQSSSLPSTQKLDSLPIIPSSDRTRSKSPTILYQPSVSILDRKADTNSDTPASLASSIPPSGADSAINVKSGYSDVVSHEDEMEEEAPENSQMTVNALGNLAGFGIGTAAAPVSTKPNPFGAVSLNKASSPASSLFTSTASGGELFRLASFSFQPIQPPQPSSPTNFGAFPSSFSLTSTSQAPVVTGFGQPAQVGQGQHALGSVLGTFGQSSSTGGFGDGFSGVSSTGGGFSNLGLATGASGFGAAATSACGFGAAATSAGGFGASATAGGGGFGAFISQQSGGSGFPAFSGSSATARAPSKLFTQMRK